MFKKRIFKKNNWLSEYKKNVTSQYGEDGILNKVFEVISTDNKWCVEFGAWDGRLYSNTWNLLNKKGWFGILIEANKNKFKDLIANNKDDNKIFCINELVDFEGKNSLDNILGRTDIPNNFDLLSIDIDGNDYHIWDSLIKYQPRVVIIEFNPTIFNDIEFVQPRDFRVNQGSSLLSIIILGKKKGYELVVATDCNAIFVKKNYYKLFNIKNNSPENIKPEPKNFGTRIYQLYDGTLVITGCTRLIWKKKKIEQEDIQVLPPEERFFSDGIKITMNENNENKK